MSGLQKIFAAILTIAAVSTAQAGVRCEAVFPSTEIVLVGFDKLRTNPVASQKILELIQKFPSLVSLRSSDNLVGLMRAQNILVPTDWGADLVTSAKDYNRGERKGGAVQNAKLMKALSRLEDNLSPAERKLLAGRLSERLQDDFFTRDYQLAQPYAMTDHLRKFAPEYGFKNLDEMTRARDQFLEIMKLPNAEVAIEEMFYLAIPDLGRSFSRAYLIRTKGNKIAMTGYALAGASAVTMVALTGGSAAGPEIIAVLVASVGSHFTTALTIGSLSQAYAQLRLKFARSTVVASAQKMISSGLIKEQTSVIEGQFTIVDDDTSALDQTFNRYAIQNYSPHLPDLKPGTIMELGQEFWAASIALSSRYSGLVYKHGDIDTALTAKVKKIVDGKNPSVQETILIAQLLQHRRTQIAQVVHGLDRLTDDASLTLQKLLELQTFMQREANENPQLQGNSIAAQSAQTTLLNQLDSVSQNISEMNVMANNLRLTQEYLAKEMGYVNLLSQTLIRVNLSRTGLSPELLQKFSEFQKQLASAKLN